MEMREYITKFKWNLVSGKLDVNLPSPFAPLPQAGEGNYKLCQRKFTKVFLNYITNPVIKFYIFITILPRD